MGAIAPRLGFMELPSTTSADEVAVAIDCVRFERVDYGAVLAGNVPSDYWYIDDSVSPPALQMVGAPCDMLRRGAERVDIAAGCPMAL